MITRQSTSTHRGCTPAVRLLGLVGSLLLTSPGSADAIEIELIQIEFQILSQSTVDSGNSNSFGSYQTVAQGFDFVIDNVNGDVLSLILKDFYIPNPVLAFATYEFLIEDPENPNTYAPMQDIPFTWDTMFDTGGEIVGRIQGEVRTRLILTLAGGSPQTSDFILSLTTDPTQTGLIQCPGGNSNPGRTGSDLPAGFHAAEGAFLTLVAGGCPDINAPTNDLNNTIVALSIPAEMSLGIPVVPGPGTGLVFPLGLIGLVAVSSRRRI